MKNKKYLYAISSLTLITTFLMGIIDAYTFTEHGGTFVSAQTGNMVSFSAKLFTGQWKSGAGHLLVFIGFSIGAYVGEMAILQSKGKGIQRYRKFIFIQTLLLLFLALFQKAIGDAWLVFFLGLFAGYELTIFRKVRNTTINNGIMTGNTKNLMNSLYLSIHQKNKKARQNSTNLSITIFLFLMGAGIGVVLTNLNANLILWIAFSLNAFIWLGLKLGENSIFRFSN